MPNCYKSMFKSRTNTKGAGLDNPLRENSQKRGWSSIYL